MHILRTASTAATLAVFVAACGSSSTSPAAATPTPSPSPTPTPPFTPPATTPTPAPTPSGPAYTVQVSLTGSDAVSGSFSEPVAQCAPPSDLSGTVASHLVELQIHVGGAASGQPQGLSPGDIDVVVDSDTWGVASSANAPHGSSGSLQRNADGSGTASFQNLALQSNSAKQPQESGSITWTCG